MWMSGGRKVGASQRRRHAGPNTYTGLRLCIDHRPTYHAREVGEVADGLVVEGQHARQARGQVAVVDRCGFT